MTPESDSYYDLALSFHPSAEKHGISSDEIAHALRNPLAELALDDDSPARLLILGPARSGDLLEIVLLVFDDNRALAIHAMPIRKKYTQLLGRPTQ